MTSILIEGADGIFTGLPGDAMRSKGSIRIANGRIVAMGNLTPEPGEERLSAAGCVIYPGLISTHHHLLQSVLKAVKPGLDSPLFAWLRQVPYRFWRKLDEESMRVASEIGLAELLLSGTTAAADHHYLFADTYRFDPADVVFETARKLGLRFIFCRGGATVARSFDTPEIAAMPTETLDHMIRSVEACAKKYHNPAPDSLTRVAFSPTTPPFALEVGELKDVIAAARHMKLRVHSHMSETTDYVEFCLNTFGKRPIHWMADHDWLGPDIWFAHCVHMDESEIRLFSETGTGMAHCPQSNCRLGSGIAPAPRLAAHGGSVSIGVDGAASNEAADMISEMHSAWHVHRGVGGSQAVLVEDVVRWSTAGGAKVLGWDDAGVLAPGKLADIAVFDLSHPRYFGMHDVLSGPVTCGGSAHVRYLLVGGRIVVEDGKIPGLDLERLRHDARRVVSRLAA
jgi:cytosine/adenosine deaminase-related metal-dependent hydrolase